MLIRPITIDELDAYPKLFGLIDEYAAESSTNGLSPDVKADVYRNIEATGALNALAAFNGEDIIGLIVVISPVMPHYGKLVSVTESFFVAKEHRQTGAGLKLLKAAEELALSKGSPGLLVSSPINGVLGEVLPHVGYEETGRVFFKRFA